MSATKASARSFFSERAAMTDAKTLFCSTLLAVPIPERDKSVPLFAEGRGDGNCPFLHAIAVP